MEKSVSGLSFGIVYLTPISSAFLAMFDFSSGTTQLVVELFECFLPSIGIMVFFSVEWILIDVSYLRGHGVTGTLDCVLHFCSHSVIL